MCPYMQTEEMLMVLEEVFVIVGLKAQRAKEFARNLKVLESGTLDFPTGSSAYCSP